MAILNNSNAISPSGYDVNNSLRFRRSASASLTRTPASATNRKTWTWSGWVKRGLLSSDTLQDIYYANNSTSLFDRMYFHNSNGTFQINGEDGAALAYNLVTTQVFRDPSAWYHIVFAFDTTQATASNRIKLYVNGVQVTAFSTASYPSLNYDTQVNNNVTQYIGTGGGGASDQLFDGYLAETHFIDGSAKTPSDFGETDTTTGVWKPKAYTGTYGTNGFYLKFSDIATTSGSNAGLGKDFSGNTNYWTTNNISVTAGTTYDAMTDSPTLTSATVANYAVMNPLAADSNATFSNANLTIASNAAGEGFIPATIDFDIASSTGYYFEVTVDSGTAYCTTGFIPVSKFPGKMWTGGTYPGQSTYNPGFEIRFSDGTILQNGGSSAYGSGATAGDTWGFAIKNGKVWARNSSGWFNSGNPVTEANPAVTGQTGQWLLGFAERAGAFGAGCTYNFGQRPFSYTPPTGFVALNTYNLPDSTIKKGNTVMDATTYTGTGATQVVTNAGSMKPDLVWLKSRSVARDHRLMDTVRGINLGLQSDLTNAEYTGTALSSINSNGFTLNTTDNQNVSAETYIAWQWQAGQGSTSSNTSGSITSTVSVNTTAGFSVVTYTGNGTSGATVGHSLGVSPKMIIVKNRDEAHGWLVAHSGLTSGYNLELNGTAAQSNSFGRGLISSYSSTTFTLTAGSGGTSLFNNVNQNAIKYVAYCWAEIAGFSAFTSYTGNGSTDGPFIFLGFRPKFVMVKYSSGVDSWFMFDTSREDYNVMDLRLEANTSNSEASVTAFADFLSNGFKIRSSNSAFNANGGTYIVAAWAENPFKNSNAR